MKVFLYLLIDEDIQVGATSEAKVAKETKAATSFAGGQLGVIVKE